MPSTAPSAPSASSPADRVSRTPHAPRELRQRPHQRQPGRRLVSPCAPAWSSRYTRSTPCVARWYAVRGSSSMCASMPTAARRRELVLRRPQSRRRHVDAARCDRIQPVAAQPAPEQRLPGAAAPGDDVELVSRRELAQDVGASGACARQPNRRYSTASRSGFARPRRLVQLLVVRRQVIGTGDGACTARRPNGVRQSTPSKSKPMRIRPRRALRERDRRPPRRVSMRAEQLLVRLPVRRTGRRWRRRRDRHAVEAREQRPQPVLDREEVLPAMPPVWIGTQILPAQVRRRHQVEERTSARPCTARGTSASRRRRSAPRRPPRSPRRSPAPTRARRSASAGSSATSIIVRLAAAARQRRRASARRASSTSKARAGCRRWRRRAALMPLRRRQLARRRRAPPLRRGSAA